MEKEAQEQEVKDKEKAKSLGTEYSSTATQEQSECLTGVCCRVVLTQES